uniref:glycerophosphocholine cholinephosphodiesterase n=1 Tax=Caenorhabditis japonica TaxID=281687 RepID=A0A8R1E0C4_CAEJA
MKSGASVAMFFFPECDVEWDIMPAICMPPRPDGKTFADESQAKRVIQATKEHDLVLIYHPWIGEEVRRKGVHHTNEKHSKEVLKFAQSLERLTAQARERVDLNVMVVSTHGMIDVPKGNIRVIDEYIPMELIDTTIGSGAIKQLHVKKGKTHQVYTQLFEHNPIPNVRIHYTNPKSTDLQDHYHFKKSDTVADLVLLADPGYAVVTKDEQKQFPKPKLHEISAAIDGYNNELPDVLGVFLAYGPGAIDF